MNHLVRIVLTTTLLAKHVWCIEIFDEKAWMDDQSRDKYFEYSDLAEPATTATATQIMIESNYSNNVDFEQFEEAMKVMHF
jgi:hypothetical protein